MLHISPENAWLMNNRELLSILNDNSHLSKPRRIHFYAPSFMYYKTSYYCSSPDDFPTISITGQTCALKCRHCHGIVLNTMYPATTPEELLELCKELKKRGARGCLISGGCLPNGSVPIGPFIETIGKIKRQLGLTVLVHTGIVDLQTAKALRKGGIDSALIDVIGSNETIKEVCNLSVTVEDYDDSLKALGDVGIAFVPHVIVGLHHGWLKGELHALEMISRYKPAALVIIAFMPIRGTEMQNIKPPAPLDIARVILAARLMFHETPLVLGCMRPKGRHRKETDVLAVRAGVDAIAFPAEEVITFVKDKGYETAFSSFCCSQIYVDIKKTEIGSKRSFPSLSK